MGLTQNMRKFILSLSLIFVIYSTTFIFHQTQSFYKSFAQGRRFYDSGDYRKALPYLASAHKMVPGDRKAAEYLLHNYEKLGMLKDATNVLETIWLEDPEDLDTIVWLAGSYYSLHDYANAELFYSDAVSMGGGPDVKRSLAEVLAWQKEYEAAAIVLKELVKEDPGSLENIELLADLYSWIDEFDTAAELYRDLLDKNYRAKDILLKLADSLRYAGKNEEAISIYKRYLDE
ncbi:MAG: tetratricopeptide repeat protein [Candidatus Omnitrophica bacterium]|nr:tetratricopeptide repeat protein [Candidatus Omnitrophota bacterium]